MAIIKCPFCGKDISEKASNCIHCGESLVNNSLIKQCNECGQFVSSNATMCNFCGFPFVYNSENIISYNNSENRKHKSIKKLIIIFSSILLLSISIILVILFLNSHPNLNNDEKLVYNCAIELRKMLKNPDSFKLYDDTFVLRHYDEDKNLECTYVIITYGATNGYGGIVQSQAIFKNGKYLMNYDDDIDEDDIYYDEKSSAYVDLLTYRLHPEKWNTYDINIKKIIKKLKTK